MYLFKRCACHEKPACEHSWWYEFVLDRQQHRKSTRTNDERNALKTAKRMREIARREAFALDEPLPPKPPTIAEHAAAYIEWANGDHPASAWRDRLTLERFVAVVGRHRRVDGIRPFDIERWRSWRLRQGVARSTINREMVTLSASFSKAVLWYRGVSNPSKAVTKFRVDDTRTRVLSPEEIRIVLTQLPPDLALLCRVTLECLPRLSEVLGLRVEHFGAAWCEIRRKGGRIARIPILPHLRSLLLERADRRTGWVFGPQVPSQGAISASFSCWFRRLGLQGVSHHTMRHTGVTLMLDAGINPRVVQHLAGWTTLRMIERYGHPRDQEARRAISANAASLIAPHNADRDSKTPQERFTELLDELMRAAQEMNPGGGSARAEAADRQEQGAEQDGAPCDAAGARASSLLVFPSAADSHT